MTPSQRVANGVKLLDEKSPNWREKINPERLDLFDPHDCVLGQVFGSYAKGKSELGLPMELSDLPANLGFCPFGPFDNHELKKAWKQII